MKHRFICMALLATAVAVPSKGAVAQAPQDIPGRRDSKDRLLPAGRRA